MRLKSYREVGREFGVTHFDVSALVRLAGLTPSRLGKAYGLSPDQLETIRPMLEKLQKADREPASSAT